MYYPKFYCKLNHIEYFWCDGKCCEGLRNDISKALAAQQFQDIIKVVFKKMDLCREKIEHRTWEWKKHSHLIKKLRR